MHVPLTSHLLIVCLTSYAPASMDLLWRCRQPLPDPRQPHVHQGRCGKQDAPCNQQQGAGGGRACSVQHTGRWKDCFGYAGQRGWRCCIGWGKVVTQ